ncbi:MAG: carboxylesterase [Flavobacteriaceae bacterium]|nr:carboxylesterase [Flavobacteriaceae bacterium]OUX39380.1 MAG: carboxylesterase [Flavobacteriaceae bacterium TMED265]
MKHLVTFILLLILFNFEGFGQLQTGDNIAIAETTSGKVRGLIRNGIFTYKGIPYATAKRFEAPTRVESWEGIRSSLNYGPVAPLEDPDTPLNDEMKFFFDHDLGSQGEDCLALNIWTPSISDDKKRPVMFWIHGGGYKTGSSQELPSYHGENLSKKGDVVVVSINHRLNILGFLDLSKYGSAHKYSANHSILDIRTALEWVQENIGNFEGDPNNVTIFGQSGGGAKVNNLMAMPSAKGLFHKAINQSGAFKWALLKKETTQKITEEVLKELHLTDNEVDSLKTIPYKALQKAGRKALKTVENKMKEDGVPIPGFGFGLDWFPSIDSDLIPYDVFSKEAMELSKNIPLLIGTVKNEFPVSAFAGMSNATEEQVKGFIQQQKGDKTEAYIKAVRQAYPNDTKPSDLMDVDLIFRPGAVHQANIKSTLLNGAPVYMYFFSWKSPVLGGKYKAFHCMELPFVFDNIARSENMIGSGKNAQILANKMSLSWINFAHTGNPGHDDLPNWNPYTKKNGVTIFFDYDCEIRYHHDKEILDIESSVK